MSAAPDIDEIAAHELIERFSEAVFERKSFRQAMTLMTPGSRREWANDWVMGELECGRDLLQWSERKDDTEALASMDSDHRVWQLFADETLETWQEQWAALPDVVHGQGDAVLSFRRHRTLAELSALGGQWMAHKPPRTGPVQIWVDVEDIDWVLHVADVVIDD
ncbi:hypothetical protein [Aeromicrobium yanjiei]|uniref:Uncharacterized protein n=1 Tax=Aeromicrobium yanjiei TaxID=2662028 RepID=A0A5Q2MN56_9ACTN|nr:hypothetical protein [Aeromicrobium yanjiei]QGG41885.1 hypothetical protein GEV26_11180 [Aeromicrobium yanjiei]